MTEITSENKLRMVRKFLRMNRPNRYWGRQSFINDAQIVWEGENYFVVRSGVRSDGCRYTWLADKVGVLCDADSPALMQIAAEWHESHTERAGNPEVLHNSYINDTEAVFTGRWCKSVKKKVIEYAKGKDLTYHEDVEAGIEAWNAARAAERAHELAQRIFLARMLKVARKFGKLDRRPGPYRSTLRFPNSTTVQFSRIESLGEGECLFAVYINSLGAKVALEEFENTLQKLSQITTLTTVMER